MAEEGAAYNFISCIKQLLDAVLFCSDTFDLVTWGSFHDDGLRTSLYHVQYQGRLASFTYDKHRLDQHVLHAFVLVVHSWWCMGCFIC